MGVKNEKNLQYLYYVTFTRHQHLLKTVKNLTEAKFELAFTRCRDNLKTVGNLTVKDSLQGFDAMEMNMHPKNRSISFQCRGKYFFFIIFECLHDAVSKMCWLELCFQGLSFSTSAGKICACEREAYASYLLAISKCAGVM